MFWGMDMDGKKKFLIVALPLGVALGLFLGQFWSFTVCALQKAVATEAVPMLVFSKLLVRITGTLFLL